MPATKICEWNKKLKRKQELYEQFRDNIANQGRSKCTPLIGIRRLHNNIIGAFIRRGRQTVKTHSKGERLLKKLWLDEGGVFSLVLKWFPLTTHFQVFKAMKSKPLMQTLMQFRDKLRNVRLNLRYYYYHGVLKAC